MIHIPRVCGRTCTWVPPSWKFQLEIMCSWKYFISNCTVQLEIFGIQLEIFAIQLEIFAIQLEIFAIQLEIIKSVGNILPVGNVLPVRNPE